MDLKHLLPKTKRYIIYYTDGYTILSKEFSALEFAEPYITKLKIDSKNCMFQFIELREIMERTI